MFTQFINSLSLARNIYLFRQGKGFIFYFNASWKTKRSKAILSRSKIQIFSTNREGLSSPNKTGSIPKGQSDCWWRHSVSHPAGIWWREQGTTEPPGSSQSNALDCTHEWQTPHAKGQVCTENWFLKKDLKINKQTNNNNNPPKKKQKNCQLCELKVTQNLLDIY